MSISRRQFILGGVPAIGASVLPFTTGGQARPVAAVRPTGGHLAIQQFQDLERLIPQLMRDGVVPGVSIAVIRNARVAWHREFGVRDTVSQARVDEGTAFQAASVSKTVFAYAVMQLRDRGILGLDTPLTTYTTDRILAGDPRLDLITARHVLSHTSGLPNFRSRAEPLRIHFTPGEKYQYSGEGYWYLQSVVTHLTGTTDTRTCGSYEADLNVCATDIDRYLAAHVLTPCQMGSSSFGWSAQLASNAARPHDAAGKALDVGKTSASNAARYAAMGGLHTTAIDYAHFLIEIMAPRASKTFRLSEASRRDMCRPQVKVNGSHSWALGWEVHHTPQGDLIQHQGGQRGVQAFTAASVERASGYVILTNSDNGSKIFYDDRFTDAMNPLLFG